MNLPSQAFLWLGQAEATFSDVVRSVSERHGTKPNQGAVYLEAAFEREIIAGPASFVVTADGEESFASAVRRKLLLEVAGVPDEQTFRLRLAARRP